MRRFFVCDKGNAKHFQHTKKCGGAKRHKGRKPDWCFAEPEPPTGGEAHTDLLDEVRPVLISIIYTSVFIKYFLSIIMQIIAVIKKPNII